MNQHVPFPQLPHKEYFREMWGDTVEDPFFWVRNDEGIAKHLEAENACTEQVLQPMSDVRDEIFQEIKSRVKETDLSVPIEKGGWAYYSRTEEGLDYPIYCRRKVSENSEEAAPEQILFDENTQAKGKSFFDLGLFEVSPDHTHLLWGADYIGNERYNAVLRNLTTGVDTPLGLEELSGGSCWSTDNKHFFYIRSDEAQRPYQVWLHELDSSSEDVLIFEEEDERFFVGVGREKDDSFIQIVSSSKVTDEVRVIPADNVRADFRLIAPRENGIEYSVSHAADSFIILTNEGAENFKVMTTKDSELSKDSWAELVPSSKDVTIKYVDVCAQYLIIGERFEGYKRIRLRSWEDGTYREVPRADEVSTIHLGANPSYETGHLRYSYVSLTSPASVRKFDFVSGKVEVLKQQEVLGGFSSEDYESRREWAIAEDGTKIPVSLVWRKHRASKPGPCLLYAYGSYEISLDPSFSIARLSLLDRGFVFAIAHVRGGGELGRNWYLDGKFGKKKNTFTDVIAAAEHLIDQKWTANDQLILRGGSAGGLMAGAVVNKRPDLFAAVVAEVPFVDVMNTMLDTSLPLTVTEWEEWGNPAASQEVYEYMKSYTPYENVQDQAYPKMFVSTGLHDPRVGFWEATKWVQELRERTTSEEPILLWADLSAGHGGPSGRYQAWREEARTLSFILWSLE